MPELNVLGSMESSWMGSGKCNEYSPGVFFPSDGAGVEIAKRICNRCEFQEICKEYALTNRVDHGVWGGTSERQRRRILKARRAKLLVNG